MNINNTIDSFSQDNLNNSLNKKRFHDTDSLVI